MNVAFPALVVFLLILPGFLFRSSFKRAEKVVLDVKPFGEATNKSIIYPLILNVVWSLGTEWFTPYRVNVGALIALLVGEKGNLQEDAIALIAKHPWAHIAYFATLFLFSSQSGTLLRMLVTAYKFDTFVSWLRFDNPWYYLFTGYDRKEPIDGVYVSTVVTLGADTFLFTGVLVQYFLDDAGTGKLDRIVLTSVSRRKIDKDKNKSGINSASRFYPIDGDYFVLRYSEIATLNIQYFLITKRNDRNVAGQS